MFLTTDNATAQAKLLLGPDRCLRLEPSGGHASIEMDDYGEAFSRLPAVAEEDFIANKDGIKRFFARRVTPRERHHSVSSY